MTSPLHGKRQQSFASCLPLLLQPEPQTHPQHRRGAHTLERGTEGSGKGCRCAQAHPSMALPSLQGLGSLGQGWNCLLASQS